MTTNKPECKTVGDCGELGISGINMTCGKQGYCENCSSDSDCNGVNAPIGKCIDNICSCLSNADCSCQGNDPYGCDYDDKGNCICSDKNKGLADIRVSDDNQSHVNKNNHLLYIGIGLASFILISGLILFFAKQSKIKLK